ncbi:hypothetical protein [Thermoflexus hugenholtzii]|uniref:Glycerophosphoryl diester phosphodiesterase membrane domain-containing protein n=1 Tax=Thermoflexus hugenholtzii JAD2 TaxID=877466 RepID=A0A212RK30_9CHLR|nr:hypothetical protein [Thermoflexus hugenholtzii]SNB72793.1 hypothetical protein SAMN02746019_00016530 [Thermoflexus hugenholtzii JAD2]
MDDRALFSRAWRIVSGHRSLWLFGFIAGFGPPMALFQFSGNAFIAFPRSPEELRGLLLHPSFPWVWAGISLLALFTLVMWLLINASGHAALIVLVNRAEEGAAPTLSAGWEAIRRYGWRIFLIHGLLRLPIFLLAGASVLPLIVPIGQALVEGRSTIPGPQIDLGLFCCCLGATIWIPALILFSWIEALADRACILNHRSIRASIAYGWNALQRHSGQVIPFALMLFGIGLGVMAPLYILQGITGYQAGQAPDLVSAPGGRRLPLMGLYIAELAINTGTAMFFSSCWTLFYRQLFMAASDHASQ